MTQEEVADLLGEPSSRKSVAPTETTSSGPTWSGKARIIWRYSKPGVWELVEIHSDEKGRVVLRFMDYTSGTAMENKKLGAAFAQVPDT